MAMSGAEKREQVDSSSRCSDRPTVVKRVLRTLHSLKTPLNYGGGKVEEFVLEWTPLGLMVSYYIFSVCMYIICSDTLISVFWWIYLTSNFCIATLTVVEALMSVSICRGFRKAVTRVNDNNWIFPTREQKLPVVDLVICAYLPNEADIIVDRITHACEKVIYPIDRIRINVVYNTPKPMEALETKLRQLQVNYSQLRIIKVPNSTSKAHNINYFLTLDTGADIISIYDADHYCHPYAPRWAVERLILDEDISVVQGRCVVFNASETVVTKMVAVEFDKIYASSHPGRAALWGFGIFAGSNGYWRAPLLKTLRMDGSMLTEDIDSALRALSTGAKIVHDLNVISYELSPTTLPALWKQRLRWAQGWAQASVRHAVLTFNKPADDGKRRLTVRIGLLSLLLFRELSYYLVTQYLCLIIALICVRFPKSGEGFVRLLFFQFPVAYWCFIVSVVCLIATLVIVYRVRSEFVTRRMALGFSVFYPFYIIIMATVGVYGHAREISNYSTWNPTSRT
ncbi:MAG: hypothetical protein M1817_004960 [Caeruleum heppii]|nr:MAG: hypothetical protein M1817_004960 [Caeruleum heppii]